MLQAEYDDKNMKNGNNGRIELTPIVNGGKAKKLDLKSMVENIEK